MKLRFEDRLQHQLQGGLHHPVCGCWDAQAAEFARRLWDRLLPHPGRGEAACLERCSQPAEELPGADDDDARNHPIDPGGASALVAPHPAPRHDEERRVIHEVVEIIEATARIGLRPLVQLGLHLLYPPLGLIQVGPRLADVHRRPPTSASLLRPRWGPWPCGRLSRPPTTTTPPPHPGGISRPRAFPPASRLLAGEGPPGVVPTFTTRPFDGVGAQLYPCGLATATPQPFTVASLPATSNRPRSSPPKRVRAATQPRSVRLELVVRS